MLPLSTYLFSHWTIPLKRKLTKTIDCSAFLLFLAGNLLYVNIFLLETVIPSKDPLSIEPDQIKLQRIN